MKLKSLILLVGLFSLCYVNAQEIRLSVEHEAVSSLLDWFEKDQPSQLVEGIVNLPANQIMEQIYQVHEKDAIAFNDALCQFNPMDSLTGQPYRLRHAYEHRSEIKVLQDSLQTIDWAESIFHKSIAFYPKHFNSSVNYKVFLCFTGWKWGDAMQFQYLMEDGKVVLCEEGSPGVLVNLAIVNDNYGNTCQQKIKTLTEVMAHELFHVLFYEYVQKHWSKKEAEGIVEELKYLMMNEGIAHYIAEKEYLLQTYGTDQLCEKEKSAFEQLISNHTIMANDSLPEEERIHALNKGTYGSYWSKYVCITGMFMAYHIEQTFGPEKLSDCIEKGVDYYFQTYREACNKNEAIPRLPEALNSTTWSGV
ncbi:hypothetical protein DMA11_19965 [Marinilabiliaceae bacterium JC017]|nr:hypothetical protein DMA11_19965 [Marinilabiliaceae bacterium JC017]